MLFFQYGDSADLTMTFLTRAAHLRYDSFPEQRTINVSTEFRTYEPNGILIYHKFSTAGYFKVSFFYSIKIKFKIYRI